MNRAALTSRFLSAMMGLPKAFVVFAALGLVGITGWIAYATGWEWDASAMYTLPIVLVVFRIDRRTGFALAFLCGIASWSAQIGNHPNQTSWGFVLALVSISFFFALVVVASDAVKAQWELGRGRIAMLERTQDLEREIVRTTEQEQQRIGRELQDGLCQTLAGIAALSTTLCRRLAAKAESGGSAEAAEITKLLNGAIHEARDLARGLGPVGLQGLDLVQALQALTLSIQRLYRVSCSLECDGSFPVPGHMVAAHLFRIVQEAVHNAVDHGRADRIEISLSDTNGEGVLSVRDNGVGLPEEAPHGPGVGLYTMAHRARMLGGSLDVRRFQPGGTVVTCVFPLPAVPDT